MDDIKVSLRQLLKTPGFTVAAIGVLALGIGLNAAMFSVLHAIGFAARPFPQPEQLVQIYSHDAKTGGGYRAFSYPIYREIASRSDVFAGVLAHNPTIVGIGAGAESRRTFSVVVSQNYFDVLGVPLLQGRGFTDEESQPGRDIPVVVATYAYWKSTGFDSALLGKTIRINERPFTVIGITPRGYTGTMTAFGPELFLPFGVFHTLSNDFQGETSRTLARADAYNLFLVGRLKQDVSTSAASEALTLFGQSLAHTFPVEYEHYALTAAALPRFGTSTSPSDESAVTTLSAVLLGMTAAVLLTVCLNLASMLLARGRARRKEFAVRLALGGGRARIVRQLLVEGMMLSFLGGWLGIALGQYAIESLIASLTRMLPITIVLEGAVSPALVGATVFFCAMATLAFALGPALKHSRADILTDLKVQTGDDPAPRAWRFAPRNPLVAGQVALSLCLLIAAGLFLRMALGAALVDLGFRADDTVLAEVDARLGGLDEPQARDLYARIEQRLAALPGVRSASIGALVPLGTVNMRKNVKRAGVATPAEGKASRPEDGQEFGAPWNAVGASYFDAMGIRLLQGRTFDDGETYNAGAPLVAVVDEVLARKLWPDGDALGQRVQFNEVSQPRARGVPKPAGSAETDASSAPIEIVGIVSTTRRELFEVEARGAIYVPFAQGFMSNVSFHVRPAAASGTLVDLVRREIREAAPSVPLFSVRTFKGHIASSPEYWALTMSSALFAFFGAMAMVVALVGIYGVTAYGVARRTREIGVRMAIGARPAAVLRMILNESLSTTIVGVSAGWVLGIGIGQVLANTFVDMSAFDVWTFSLVPVGFVVAALLATWVPARRATHINPLSALRTE
jgi:predicted permease